MASMVIMLSGCGPDFDWDISWGGGGGNGGSGGSSSTEVVLLSQAGKINRPLLGGGDDWVVQPFDRQVLLFATGFDQYGNPTGLRDDTIWKITEVEINCEDKGFNDTVFNPGDPYKRYGFSVNGIENACVWYPLYTAEMEGITKLPFSLVPEVGYPFDACRDLGCPAFLEQKATISAKAKADYITIRITVPDNPNGDYILDLPGSVPQSSNVFELNVGSWGKIGVVWSYEDRVMLYTVDVPAEWFWTSGQWDITVMGTGTV